MPIQASAVCARRPRAGGLAFALPLPGKKAGDSKKQSKASSAKKSVAATVAEVDSAVRTIVDSNSFKYLFAGVRCLLGFQKSVCLAEHFSVACCAWVHAMYLSHTLLSI
jgi:hypothetical protein